MNNSVSISSSNAHRAMAWCGRVISGLAIFVFGMSAVMKLKGGPAVTDGMEHLGLPEPLVVPLAVLELSCVVIYLIPRTSVLGAILLTGYIGGAICTHLRVGDAYFIQVSVGVLIWLGLYFRDERIRKLIPLRALQPAR